MISVPRRCFLGLAGAVVLGMTGCQASVPVVRGGPTAPPLDASPTPSPVRPDQDTALGHEITLSAMAGQAHESADALDLGPGQRATVGWLATGHSLHASALEHPNPAHRSTTPPPPVPGGTPRPRPPVSESLTGSTREEALDQLRNRLQRALEDYRRATGETRGSTALVWGSLAAYARSAQTALVRDAARPEPPDIPARELAPWSDAEAEQQALRQIHALIYGYQVAIARLSGEENRAARDALVQRRTQRDRLAATLRERGQAAPAAEPAYALPHDPTDRDSAAELLWRMEVAYAPFAGAWLAAATDSDARGQALDSLEQSVVLAVDWGGPLVVWPGWPG